MPVEPIMTKPSDKRCAGCEYFEENEIEDERGGFCHRHPPALIYGKVPESVLKFDFPEVNKDDWCGEHCEKWP